MGKPISSHFADELRAAGLSGLPFAWGDDGTFQFDPRITSEQRIAIEAVYAAHDPADALKLTAREDARRTADFDGNMALIAVARWVAGKLGMPLAQARSEILAIYRSL